MATLRNVVTDLTQEAARVGILSASNSRNRVQRETDRTTTHASQIDAALLALAGAVSDQRDRRRSQSVTAQLSDSTLEKELAEMMRTAVDKIVMLADLVKEAQLRNLSW